MTDNTYKDILLALDPDLDEVSMTALNRAIAYSEAFGSVLHLMIVVPDFGMSIVAQNFPADFEEKALAATKRQLDELVAEKIPEGVSTQVIVAHGSPYDEVLNTAKSIGADLIVVGAHRTELKDYFLGTTAARIVRHAPCSVVVVRL